MSTREYTPGSDSAETPTVEISGSRQFTAWLAEQNLSLAFTTYRAGKLFLIGLNADGKLSIFERTFERCMGLFASQSGLVMSSLYQLWRFENALPAGEMHDGYDRAYVPQVGYVTGDLDIHDVALDPNDQPIFVNTLFSCLATTDDRHSFTPLWQPPFISKLAAEDRCHLNGLALHEGQPRFVTAVSQSDVADGWRDFRRDGGCVIDVPSSTVIAGGLSMPHSPRIYQGKLWMLDSGNGNFGFLDLDTAKFEAVTFLPGYGRGLAFHGDFAVVGLSLPRGTRTFEGLALEENMAAKNVEPRCALHVIDLRTGDAVHWLRIDGIVEELYDVIAMPGVRRPMAIGFRTDEVRRVITVGEGPEVEPSSAPPTPAGLNSPLVS
ncbi:MAG: TIGR03032 family protein [Rhodospirillaceae bacterium]|nr:TIGR03032 family protein [Rhodospirillaceae bacterium]MDP6621559.1 TIGR03032 family protein [Alphaproteobacteria bacterium]